MAKPKKMTKYWFLPPGIETNVRNLFPRVARIHVSRNIRRSQGEAEILPIECLAEAYDSAVRSGGEHMIKDVVLKILRTRWILIETGMAGYPQIQGLRNLNLTIGYGH
jgi:hypothetical protein